MSTKKVTERTRKRTTGKASGNNAAALEAGRQAYMKGDFDAARDVWMPLADGGDSEAQAWVGSLFANGDGVEPDQAAAFKWYLKSAEGGNVQAQANVGAFYAMGQGVETDMTAAVRWIRRAGRNGDAHAQFNMAVLYSNGNGVRQSEAKAVEWYRKAAEGGHYPSQGRLGHMYYVGQGVEKDRVEAFLWLSLAGQHGIGSALTELEKVVEEMSSEEKAKGAQLVDVWLAKTCGAAGPSTFTPLPG